MFSSLHPCFQHRLAPLLLNKWISAWKCVMHITFFSRRRIELVTHKGAVAKRTMQHCLFAFLFQALCDLLWGLFMLSDANLSRTAAYITHQLKHVNRSGTLWLVIVFVAHEQRKLPWNLRSCLQKILVKTKERALVSKSLSQLFQTFSGTFPAKPHC